MSIVVCSWCLERPARGGGLDPIGEPWCVRCKSVEEALQQQRRDELNWLGLYAPTTASAASRAR